MALISLRQLLDHAAENGYGVGAFNVGNAFLRNRRIVTLGRPVMRRLMEDVGETVNLAVEDQNELVYVTQFESHAPMRAFFRPGRRAPMHACPDHTPGGRRWMPPLSRPRASRARRAGRRP